MSRVAVVGSGVAGLTAAYLLQRRHEVSLFEAADRLGGHAHTHEVLTADGTQLAVDTGFIVHNERTYPNLLRLFGELGVRTRTSEMSMSVRCLGCGLEYAGGKGLSGLFAQRRNLARPGFVRMLAELARFHRDALRLLDGGGAETTLEEFLRAHRYSGYFVEHLVLPLISAVWSSGSTDARRYPARYLFAFLRHHGLLSVGGSPVWRTVEGGSRTYVQRAVKHLTAVLPGTPIRSLRRHPDGVTLRDAADEPHEFDRVVIATHPDQALRMLADPSAAERDVLGAFRYSRNETLLHHDTSVLPRVPGARASWNYLKPGCLAGSDEVLVNYDLTRLMRLPGTETQVVTLNAADHVDERTVRARMTYEHPVYTHGSVAAQAELPGLGGDRTAYAGAYHGWGFHEDGCAAGMRAAAAFGVSWV